MTSRVHLLGPLACVALGVTLSFFEVWALAWLPMVVAWFLVLSLTGAMWKAARGGRAGELAVVLALLPGVSAVGSLWAFGAWPSAARAALTARGADAEDAPSSLLFAACALLWSAASSALFLYPIERAEWLGASAGGLWLLFFLLWLPASREALSVVEALDAQDRSPHTDAPPSEWSRERAAVRAALINGGGAERAWADDVLARHARRGEPEAVRWAEARSADDPATLADALAEPER